MKLKNIKEAAKFLTRKRKSLDENFFYVEENLTKWASSVCFAMEKHEH